MGRATLNYGVRADQIHGGDGRHGAQVYKHRFAWARASALAVDLFGDGKSVLRAYYGRMYEGANVTPFEQAVTGIGDYVTYEVGPGYRTLTETDRVSGASKYRVDPNINQVGLDEFIASWEQQLRERYEIYGRPGSTATTSTSQHSVLPAARWTPIVRTNPLTNQPITVYRWNNRSVGEHT